MRFVCVSVCLCVSRLPPVSFLPAYRWTIRGRNLMTECESGQLRRIDSLNLVAACEEPS